MQDPSTRARQHLLLQGFTSYTAEAAVSLVLQGQSSLDDVNHAWSVELNPQSWRHTERLATAETLSPLAQLLMGAGETCRQDAATGVLCCVVGATLLEKLEPAAVQGVRMRIEAAIALGKQPPVEKLEAFSDEAIEKEAKRRKKAEKAKEESPPAAPVQEAKHDGNS